MDEMKRKVFLLHKWSIMKVKVIEKRKRYILFIYRETSFTSISRRSFSRE